MAESELEKLRQDIAILTEKYEQAKEDIHKAANAGLELLRQKEDLEKRLAEMQAELDLARTEIDKTNQVSIRFRK